MITYDYNIRHLYRWLIKKNLYAYICTDKSDSYEITNRDVDLKIVSEKVKDWDERTYEQKFKEMRDAVEAKYPFIRLYDYNKYYNLSLNDADYIFGVQGDKGAQGKKGYKGNIGEIGPQGYRGDIGDEGVQGDMGPKSKIASISETFEVAVFAKTYIGVRPVQLNNSEGEFDFDTYELKLDSDVWKTDSDFGEGEYDVYVSTRNFHSNGLHEDWTYPVKINGLKGTDSEDCEYIYTITEDEYSEVPSIGISENKAKFVPEGWYGTAVGLEISKKMQCIWIAMRLLYSYKCIEEKKTTYFTNIEDAESYAIGKVCTIEKIDSFWSDWIGPNIHTLFGKKGRDGDGMEYIFTRSSETKINRPFYEISDTEYFDKDSKYQNIEQKPEEWYDDSTDNGCIPTKDKPYQFMSYRKTIVKSGVTYWDRFSEPEVWDTYIDSDKNGSNVNDVIWTSDYYVDLNSEEYTIINKDGKYEFVKTDPHIILKRGDRINNDDYIYLWNGESWVGPLNNSGSILHIKYAKTLKYNNGKVVGGEFTEDSGESTKDAEFVGMCFTELIYDPIDIAQYTWKTFNGEDGFDIEYIYKRVDTEDSSVVDGLLREKNGNISVYVRNDYTITSSDDRFQEDNFIPDGWTDDRVGVDENNLYEWCTLRKYDGSKWGDFIRPYLVGNYAKNDSKDGSNSKIIINKGEWSPNDVYKSTETTVDCVYVIDKGYYIFYNNGQTGETRGGTVVSDDKWVEMKNYQFLHSEFIDAETAEIGCLIFNGHYIFSCKGVDGHFDTTGEYGNFYKLDPYYIDYSYDGYRDIKENNPFFYDYLYNRKYVSSDVIANPTEGVFKPHWTVNLKEGYMAANHGNVLAKDGSLTVHDNDDVEYLNIDENGVTKLIDKLHEKNYVIKDDKSFNTVFINETGVMETAVSNKTINNDSTYNTTYYQPVSDSDIPSGAVSFDIRCYGSNMIEIKEVPSTMHVLFPMASTTLLKEKTYLSDSELIINTYRTPTRKGGNEKHLSEDYELYNMVSDEIEYDNLIIDSTVNSSKKTLTIKNYSGNNIVLYNVFLGQDNTYVLNNNEGVRLRFVHTRVNPYNVNFPLEYHYFQVIESFDILGYEELNNFSIYIE